MKKVSAMLWIVGVCLACKPSQPDVSTEFVGVGRCASCHMEALSKMAAHDPCDLYARSDAADC